jgi:sigma-B regulation protein RsbU (phosphoserine phosphatase)
VTGVDSNARFDWHDFLEDAPCGYISLLINGRIEYVNRTFLNWCGHSADRMIGKRLNEFLTIPGSIYYETHIAPLLRMQGFFEEFAIDVLKADGQPVQMIANANERRDREGKPLSIRLALIRATDRRRYEQGLLAAREMARTSEQATQAQLLHEHESSELREQFVAVLGHDLLNPLASLSAGARILDRTVQSEKERQVIAMMQTTVMRMAGLIDDVLDFARGRLGAGIALDRRSSQPLEPILAQVVDELRLASPGRAIEANFKLDRPVSCDSSRLGQMLSNLLGNALTHGSASEPVRVHAETTQDAFELWVANAGEPIPASAMEKLFEPFFRGNARASRQGLGLGLYIASQIAKAHGGELAVRSTAEETRVTFTMPLKHAH